MKENLGSGWILTARQWPESSAWASSPVGGVHPFAAPPPIPCSPFLAPGKLLLLAGWKHLGETVWCKVSRGEVLHNKEAKS